MYVVLIEEIIIHPTIPQRIRYKLATLTESGDYPTKVNWEKLGWRGRKADIELPVGGRTILFTTSTSDHDPEQTSTQIMQVDYDNYYGGLGGPNAAKYAPPTRIAIIHKDYLADNPLVDLTKFSFKAWEDGLGNRCDKSPSDRNATATD
jgi:hypothetical protein